MISIHVNDSLKIEESSTFLRNLIDFTDPMVPVEVPKYPDYQPRIKGLNFTDEIDDNLPEFVHPWMPSIKGNFNLDLS